MKNFIVLSESDIQRLDEAREAEGWSRENDSEALIEASRYLIDSFFERDQVSGTYLIPWRCLKDWIDREQVYVTSEGKPVFRKFESQKMQASDLLTLQDINDLIDERIIRAKGISQDSLRWCTDIRYPKRKSQKKPKKIEYFIIESYCEVLGIPISTLEGYRSQPESKKKDEQLYRILTQFNHTQITSYLNSNLASQPIRKDIIYFPALSHLYEIWFLRRLEQEINTLGHFETHKIIFDLAENSQEWHIRNLFKHFYKNSNSNDIDALLKRKNLILLFKNIDYQSLDYLSNTILNQFWQDMTKDIQNSRGFLLMVWLDRGKTNDWRDNFQFFDKIYRPPITSNFSQQDFQVILPKLAQEFQQPELFNNQQDEINNLWQASQQGQIEATLKAFYRRFNCKLASETRWQNYL